MSSAVDVDSVVEHLSTMCEVLESWIQVVCMVDRASKITTATTMKFPLPQMGGAGLKLLSALIFGFVNCVLDPQVLGPHLEYC
jgi:hypothetical protein